MLTVTGRTEEGKTLSIDRCIQFETYRLFEDLIGLFLEGDEKTIILDLGELERINLLTVERIMRLDQRLADSGRNLRLTGCNRRIMDVFESLQMDLFMRIDS